MDADACRESLKGPRAVWRVGDLLVDVGRRTVHREGAEIALPALSFDLLVALIETAPEVADTDELLTRVWRRVVVSYETLSQRVKLLRDALGDDPRHPRYVLGVRGRGYRLVPQPIRVNPEQPAAPASVPADPPARGKDDDTTHTGQLRPWLIAVSLAAVIVVAVLVYLQARISAPADGESPPTSAAIAVMKFRPVGSSPEEGALANGIAEAVLHRLAGLRDVTVIARRSSFALQPDELDVKAAGRKLGARYLLGGSVQVSGGTVRVRTELTDASTGAQLWSMQTERPDDGLLAIQDEIASRVAASIAGGPSMGPAPDLIAAGTISAAAQLAILQARALIETRQTADLEQAITLCDEAMRLDPAFALAYATSADALLTLADARDDQRPTRERTELDKAATRSARALELDGNNAEALVSRARIETLRGDPAAAERDFSRAVGLRPNDADGWRYFATFLFYGLDPFERPESGAGKMRRDQRISLALAAADRARQIDPLSPMNQYLRGLMAQHIGRPADAEPYMLAALRLDPGFHPALARLAQYRWLDGHLADAIALGERAIAIDPHADWIRRLLSQFYVDIGDPAAGKDVLREGGPQLEDGRLAVLLFENDVIEAGNLAGGDTARQPRSWDRDLSAFALRERARLEPAVAAQTLTRLRSRISNDTSGAIHHGSRFAALMAADMMIEAGDREAGKQLVHAVLDAVAADAEALSGAAPTQLARADDRQRALGLALLGDHAGARSVLAQLVDQRKFRHLWYDIEYQPAFEAIRSMPAFEPVLERYRTQIQQERALLAELRAKGAVPARGE
jgi:TolB-like protein/DNA-binding winged helix-turn-helix (wHTH) protein/tetratricopeptide (TPR) repeat protein